MKHLEISMPVAHSSIHGSLTLVDNAKGLVVFAHGSGSSRFSTRNIFVADFLNLGGISTFLFDLLTPEEEGVDQYTREFRFDIPLLANRLVLVTEWLKAQPNTSILKLGYFGASTGAAAALIAAAKVPHSVSAVVSRGGRPDLAGDYLPKVEAATLLLVGQLDYDVIKLNEMAFAQLLCQKKLVIVPHATHLFEEEGTLEEVSKIALEWFMRYL
jgi:pimeloyl-ACP methyl ester carboxylesterase